MSKPATVRLAHLSDVHITAKPLGWKPRDLASKRVTGWMNVALLGRGFRFRHAPRVTSTLVQELKQRRLDHLIFSGDATALAFDSEFAAAAQILGVADPELPQGLAVPGNHDCYVKRAVTERLFERHFAPWQKGERIGEETYPFAQRVGHVWLLGVNSSRFNLLTWDASGRIGAAQLERLRQLLARLPSGPRILVTHYPFAVHNGRQERRGHGLRDWRAAAKVAAEGGVKLWLHGYRHRPYWLTTHKEVAFPGICGGSATQTGIWSYHEYAIAGSKLTAVRRVYVKARQAFEDRETFELELG